MATRRRYIDIPDHARRDFIKWTIGLGAALGLRPWKVFEVQESIVGPAVADSAACAASNRFVGFVHGNGANAWNTLMWPYTGQITATGGAHYAIGKGVAQAATGPGDHPMLLGPDAPKLAGKPITGIVCGQNDTHNIQNLANVNLVAAGVSMSAAAAAIQTISPTLVPAITVGTLGFGAAPGAPAPAAVPNAAGMVGLFNAASSLAGGALANASDAALFEAYYKANLGLHAAAARPTMTSALLTGKVAANLLGKNLASQLTPTAADLTRYGIATGTAAELSAIGNALITTAKAFALNLTSHVMMPCFLDDPHGAFADVATTTATVQSYAKMLDAFMADVMAVEDPMCAGRKIGDNLVMAWAGDTPKDALVSSVWPDSTIGNHNILYVLGNGWTKSGWFGGVDAGGTLSTWDPPSGSNTTTGMTSAALAGPASAAALFAVARGDLRRVDDFYRGVDISGVINKDVTGA